MPSSSKYLSAAAAVIILIACIYFYKEYHRKPADVLSMQTFAVTDAMQLINAFETNEATANAKYLGKTIEVKGTVLEVVKQADTLINIFLGDHKQLNKVSCLVDAAHLKEYNQLKPGSICTIKGICTGYLMDVELNSCVIIK